MGDYGGFVREVLDVPGYAFSPFEQGLLADFGVQVERLAPVERASEKGQRNLALQDAYLASKRRKVESGLASSYIPVASGEQGSTAHPVRWWAPGSSGRTGRKT